jgi:hypothetical protein
VVCPHVAHRGYDAKLLMQDHSTGLSTCLDGWALQRTTIAGSGRLFGSRHARACAWLASFTLNLGPGPTSGLAVIRPEQCNRVSRSERAGTPAHRTLPGQFSNCGQVRCRGILVHVDRELTRIHERRRGKHYLQAFSV